MQLYRIYDTDLSDRPTRWAGTSSDAQAIMKQTDPVFRSQVRIDLCEVPTDKVNVLAMLDGQKIAVTVIRSWVGNSRGGMTQLTSEPAA